MLKGRDIRAKLHSKRDVVFGTCITSPSPHLAPAVRSIPGLDFVFIDTEHIPIGRETLAWMCRTYRSLGLPPLVRIPTHEPQDICAVLDGGACGVLCPYVETVAQVRAMVGATKFRPIKGRKLDNFLNGTAKPTPDLQKFMDRKNQDIFLCINIESQAAVDKLDALVSVPGVDAVMVGPHDLSCSLNIPEQWNHPKFLSTLEFIIQTSRKHGVGVGIHYAFDKATERQVQWVKMGANIVMHSSDIKVFVKNMSTDIAFMRTSSGHAPAATATDDGEDVTAV